MKQPKVTTKRDISNCASAGDPTEISTVSILSLKTKSNFTAIHL